MSHRAECTAVSEVKDGYEEEWRIVSDSLHYNLKPTHEHPRSPGGTGLPPLRAQLLFGRHEGVRRGRNRVDDVLSASQSLVVGPKTNRVGPVCDCTRLRLHEDWIAGRSSMEDIGNMV